MPAVTVSACGSLVSRDILLDALRLSVQPSGGPTNGGLDNHVWAVFVDRTGIVRAICHSGEELGDQWPASRAVAIAKANTANGLSLPKFAFSTANLYSGDQPGGYLFGVELANPLDTATAYAGDPGTYGTTEDPMVGRKASGTVTFGGGLALYDSASIIGAIGISGDTSCGDHNIAWRVRQRLGLDNIPAGITAKNNDAIIYDFGILGKSSSGYGHPTTGLNEPAIADEIGASAPAK